ncbi:MAG: hypothetical protein WBM08_08895 [Prochlorococcaceae cyanobacterium]
MARNRLQAVGLPVVVLVVGALVLQRWGERLPPGLQRVSECPR